MTVDIQAIRASNPLESIVQRFTGHVPERHKIPAPWRDERTPSVHIYPDGKFKDFGGEGWHGDVIDFVGYYLFGHNYDPDVHFLEVVDRLGALDIKPLSPAPARTKPQPTSLSTDLQDIHRWHNTMPLSRREYWHSRGLIDSTVDKYLLGWDGRRYTIPGLYRNIPFCVKRRQSEIDDGIEHKYVMTTGSRAGLYNADILWETSKVVICEGEIDCLLLNQYGYPAVSSTAGANTWKPQWAHLFSHVRQIWLLYDNDEAGIRGGDESTCDIAPGQDRAPTAGSQGYRGTVRELHATVPVARRGIGMIFRTVKDKEHPHTRTSNAVINDERLSFKAIGIMVYILSKPDGWEANEADMAKRHTEGLSAVRAGVQELLQYGYMVRVQIRKDKKIVGWRLDTYESPDLNPHYKPGQEPTYVVEYLDLENRNLGKQDLENLDVGNLDLENRNLGDTGEKTRQFDQDCEKLDLGFLDVENRNHSNNYKEVNTFPNGKVIAPNGASPPSVDESEPTDKEQAEWFAAICWLVYEHQDYKLLSKTDSLAIGKSIKKIRKSDKGYTIADLRSWYKNIWSKEWPGKQDDKVEIQRPTLKQIETGIGRVKQVKPADMATPANQPSYTRLKQL